MNKYFDDSSLILAVVLMVYVLVFLSYYVYQNKNPKHGGKISKPKIFWLGFAMFVYFVLPIYLYYISNNFYFRNFVWTMILLAYGRMLVQGLFMYLWKIWIPSYGIAINILYIVAMISWITFASSHSEIAWNIKFVICFLATQFALVASVDSYYARAFHRMMGSATKGDSPIWFASDDTAFSSINKLTRRWNLIFAVGLLIILVLVNRYV